MLIVGKLSPCGARKEARHSSAQHCPGKQGDLQGWDKPRSSQSWQLLRRDRGCSVEEVAPTEWNEHSLVSPNMRAKLLAPWGAPSPPCTLSLSSLWGHKLRVCGLPSPHQLLSLEPLSLPWLRAGALPISLPQPSPRLARWESPPGTQTWLAAVGLDALAQ